MVIFMAMLNRKLLRDLISQRWQLLAIIAVIACGISTFVLSTSTIASLENTRSDYYRRYRFADIFCDLKRAPNSTVQQIAELPGVVRWETRIALPIRIDTQRYFRSVQGLALSIPNDQPPELNALHLRKGRYPEANSPSEVLISEAFATAHQLNIGDQLKIILYGQQYQLTIVGIALSPEFIYEISPTGLLPDNRSFGVVWIRRNAIEGSADLEGAFNNITLQLAPTANRKQLIAELDLLLARYGSLGAIQRSDQRSHRFVSSEMDELRNMGLVAPTIFLCVAAFLMNMVLSRMITTQREQIAALKAFGFTNWEIALVYLKMAWLTAILGAICGLALGMYLGQGLTAMYSRFFHFPSFSFSVPPIVILTAMLISLSAASIAVFNGVRNVILLQPAEAMRPEPPVRYRQTEMETLWTLLGVRTVGRMVLRHLSRRPKRSMMSLGGISLAVAVLILGSFMQDAIYALFDTLFTNSKKYDLQVSLVEATDEAARFEIESIPGVFQSEAIRSIPVRASHKQHQRLVGILASDPPSHLAPLVTVTGHKVPLPRTGAMISRKLAEVLDLQVGDQMTAVVLEEDRETLTLPIVALIEDAAGETIYVDRHYISQMMAESPRINSFYLRIDSALQTQILKALEEMPRISHVTSTQDLRQSFLSTIAENVARMRSLNLTFSLVIAIGVIYSTARISIAERSRELATLRVLGFSLNEITLIILAELFILTLLAIPVGWWLGFLLCYSTVNFFDRELFRVPLVIRPHTYAFAAIVAMTAMVGASYFVRQILNKMDIIEVLKARD